MTQNTHVVLTPITYNVVPSDDIALVGPLVVPRNLAAIERHEEQSGHGYTADMALPTKITKNE